MWLTLVSDWQRGTFAILYFTPESVYSNFSKRKKKEKKKYIDIEIYIKLALMFKVTKDPRRQSATSKS